MVKNVSGGNKSKGFARKDFARKVNRKLRLSEDEAEVYAQVRKIYGGAACQVVTLDGIELLCHIRGKFRGRGKRDNFISIGTWLLVGLREWENKPAHDSKKLSQCDVIEVYNDSDKERIKSTITSINWSLFVSNDNKTIGTIDYNDGDISFTDEKTQEYLDLIESQISTSKKINLNSDNDIEINVDDI
jgi:translation initiation factor IF-1